MLEAGILDPYLVKYWGIKLATNTAVTVLRVDQVSRPTKRTDLCNHLQHEDLVLLHECWHPLKIPAQKSRYQEFVLKA